MVAVEAVAMVSRGRRGEGEAVTEEGVVGAHGRREVASKLEEEEWWKEVKRTCSGRWR